MTWKLLLALIALALTVQLPAQDSLVVQLSDTSIKKGDTLNLSCRLVSANGLACTLNVWIENIKTGRTWKYRYPLINKESRFSLVADSSLADGAYAINMLVQRQFCVIQGKVRNYTPTFKELSMLLMSRGKENHTAVLVPDSTGKFSAGKFLFNDTATVIIRNATEDKTELVVDMQNYLDSAFTASAMYTAFVYVGDQPPVNTATAVYQFRADDFVPKGNVLPEVTLVSPVKKNVVLFDKEYTRGFFRSNGKLYDGIDSKEIAESKDVLAYLMRQPTGITITSYNGFYKMIRRFYPVDIFINEVRSSIEDLQRLNPAEVTMIKIFDPSTGPDISRMDIGGGGAIAVYTKNDRMPVYSRQGNVFDIRGYTPDIIDWR